jgi:3-dehydroquinate dehydratase-1
MSAGKIATEIPPTPLVVGTIHSPGSLKVALRLRPGDVDLLELRVDHFAGAFDLLRRAIPRLNAPRIVTVRHPAEGGANRLSFSERAELYREFADGAAYIDVELRSAAKLTSVVEAARDAGARIILSDHHFRSTPSIAQLEKQESRSRGAGADLFKIATHVSDAAALARLLTFLSRRRRVPLSVMGMGPFGKISRLLFARAGSLLNYGYLDEPQVPGQWEARLLKKRIAEL